MKLPSPYATIERIVRAPRAALAVALVLSAIASLGIFNLRVYTSRKALLPSHVEVARRLEDYLRRFGAANDLIVVLQGASPTELEAFATELAGRLKGLPEVRTAVERVDLRFFLEHSFLLTPPEALERFATILGQVTTIPPPDKPASWGDALDRLDGWFSDPTTIVEAKIDLAAAEEGLFLLDFFLDQWQMWIDSPVPPTAIQWHRVLARHGAEAMSRSYFASHDGLMLFVFVGPRTISEEFVDLNPFIAAVRGAASAQQALWKGAGRVVPTVGLTGLPAIACEEYQAIQRDIAMTTITAGVLVILLILLWLRSVRWALVVFVPMGIGVIWNLGLAYVLIGHLTMITAGFTAILFGLGVDYGIFMSSRIMEERDRPEADLRCAIATGTVASARALLTAGGATVLIFGALATVEFPGFAELGIVAAAGVALVLLATFLIQPALYALLPPRLDRRRPERDFVVAVDAAEAAGEEAARAGLSRLVGTVGCAAIVLLGVSAGGLGAWSSREIPFDYDVLSLLPEDSEAAALQRRMVAESDFQGEVVIFTAPSVAESKRLAAAASRLPAIARVQTVTDLFPSDAPRRTALARQIGTIVADSVYAERIRQLRQVPLTAPELQRLPKTLSLVSATLEEGEEQAFSVGHTTLVERMEGIIHKLHRIADLIRQDPGRCRERTEDYVRVILDTVQTGVTVLESWRQATPLTPEKLPEMVRSRFFGADGTVAFYAFPAASVYDPAKLDELIAQIYSVSNEVTGFPTTHHVFSKMVVGSFVHGTLLAVLVAVIWIFGVLRSARDFAIAASPLLLGCGWMLALMFATGSKFNYANIIALPLVMGAAVDYGVWFAHRRRELAHESAWQVSRRAGHAILLAAGTTLAGLGAITLASYRGVASMGLAITMGVVCCVVAALVVSPALSELLYRKR